MTRAVNMLFRESPYWGWIVAGAVFLVLIGVWLLAERFGPKWAQGTRTVVRVRSTVFTAFVVLDLILLILLSNLHVGRVDLTRDNLYSLSGASRDLVAKLDDVVTVEVFFPEDVPPEMAPFREALVDLLDEFRAAAGGQLAVKYLDPRDAGVVERAKNLGIEPQPFQTIEADRQVTKHVMRGLAVTYAGRTERIPVIDRDVGLEYQIATLVRTLTGKPAKIGLLGGHKELDGALERPQFLDTLKSVLSYHEIISVNLDGGARAVPADVRALLMTTPIDPIPEAELYQIDQFLMRGGALAFMGNGFTVVQPPEHMRMLRQQQPQFPEIKPLDDGLDRFLAHFGLSVGDDVILNDDSADGVRQRVVGLRMTRGGAVEREFSMMTNFFWTKDIDADHPLVAGLSNLLVYQSSTVDLSDDVRKRADVKLATLVRSSPRSWLGSSSEVFIPMHFGGAPPQKPETLGEGAADDARARAERGPRPILVAVEGPMTSFFEGKDVPSPAVAGERKDKSDGNVRILGFGSPVPLIPEALKGGLAGDPGLKDMPMLLLNAVDWLLAEKGLLEVRGKTADPPQFASEPDRDEQFKYKMIFTLGLPFLFVAVSLAVIALARPARGRSAPAARKPSSEGGVGPKTGSGPEVQA